MSLRLIMIAHAETDATRRGAFPKGEGLNAKGMKAAREQWMAMPKRDAAFASPAPAARETASVLGLAAEIDKGLGEWNVGRWRGETLGDIAKADPDAAAAWRADPAFDDHGGESLSAMSGRVAAWLAGAEEKRGTVIAVTHAAVCRAALIAILGAPATAFWHIEVEPMSMMTLGREAGR
jgi:broad specificity phosphatase PhoE